MKSQIVIAVLSALLEHYDSSSRRFPSAAALMKAGVADYDELAEAARQLWKRDWASAEIGRLRHGGATPVLDLLPQTRAFAKSCLPANFKLGRLHALNEILGYHGIEEIPTQRRERINGVWETVTGNGIVALYLNAGDPYAPTLILRSDSGTPVIGCWGDMPEVNR